MRVPHLFVDEQGGSIKRLYLDDNFAALAFDAIPSVNDFGWNGAGDATFATQAAFSTSPYIRFLAGYTYPISADIQVPSNRKIIVEKGATILVTGGRFTSYNTTNVEWQIDGVMRSIAMATAPDKPGWFPGERGFIEFGMAQAAGQASSGFWVHGTGIVAGDFVGASNFANPAFQINRKGIACWNSQNVGVSELEVFGFDGEAVYAWFFDTASNNIVFTRNNVHDTRFNALNFNAAANGGGCKMFRNRAKNAYAVEISAGECTENYVDSMIVGIWTGVGNGAGPLAISRNTVLNSGGNGISAAFANTSPVTGVEIDDNVIVNSAGYSIFTDYIREFAIRGNKCEGTGQTLGSYDIGLNHALRGTVSENTFLSPGANAQPGRIAVDVTTCFDVSVDPDSNVYIPTPGTAMPGVANGSQVIASAAALPIPVLGSVFSISGATNITSLASAAFSTANAGRKISLVFQGILTVTDGSNLKLAGNFVTTADDVLCLMCDGANWFETSRSVN